MLERYTQLGQFSEVLRVSEKVNSIYNKHTERKKIEEKQRKRNKFSKIHVHDAHKLT